MNTDNLHQRLILMTGPLVRGGMEMQFLDLAREHRHRGGEIITIAAPGPLEQSFKELGRLITIPHPIENRNAAMDLILAELTPGSSCVVALQTDYFSFIPILALRSRVLICAHNRSGTFESWLPPPSLARFGQVLRALAADNRLAMSASNRFNAAQHARLFKLGNDKIQPWYPSIANPLITDIPRKKAVITIGIVARLSPEKLLLLEAALPLLRVALDSGADARLVIAGSGQAKAQFEECVSAAKLTPYVKFIGETTDAVKTCRRFDVTVANGRVALEALLAGSRVVAVSVAETDNHERRLHSVVTPDNVVALADENFAPGLNDIPAAEIWAMTQSLSNRCRRFLQNWVVEHRSPKSIYDMFVKQLEQISPTISMSKTSETLSQAYAIDDALYSPVWQEKMAQLTKRVTEMAIEMEKAQEWIVEQRNAIEWLAEQRDIWEKTAKEYRDRAEYSAPPNPLSS